jgi:hypothetical protein
LRMWLITIIYCMRLVASFETRARTDRVGSRAIYLRVPKDQWPSLESSTHIVAKCTTDLWENARHAFSNSDLPRKEISRNSI